MSYQFNPFTGTLDASEKPVTVSASAPSSPQADALWFDTATSTLRIYYNGEWVPTVTGSSGGASTAAAYSLLLGY